MIESLWLIPLGFIVGTLGTLLGVGGGVILVPVLLLWYPHENAALITSISLAVIFFNALSGSIAYARMKRIDYRSAAMFSLAAVPGAILGAYSTSYIPRRIFNLIFGVLMVSTCVFLWLKSVPKSSFKNQQGPRTRQSLGITLSFFVGYISSLLGIGGGIIHVPVLVHLLNFPIHIATATSQLILAVMALAGTLVHLWQGVFVHGFTVIAYLALGVLMGAQVGARLSNRFHEKWLIRGLAIAIGFAGLRILFMG